MKSRPIIFSAESIHAILAGNKTQTRRVVRGKSPETQHCRYGVPGDHLWVKEVYAFVDASEFPESVPDDGRPVRRIEGPETYKTITFARYRASEFANILCDHEKCIGGPCLHPWRSPLMMPRWASRITLGITGVRDERLQDASEDDLFAEGFLYGGSQQDNFRDHWDDLNLARGFGWGTNPRIRVISFRVISATRIGQIDQNPA